MKIIIWWGYRQSSDSNLTDDAGVSGTSIASIGSMLLEGRESSRNSDHELERPCLRIGSDHATSKVESIRWTVWYGEPLGYNNNNYWSSNEEQVDMRTKTELFPDSKIEIHV